MNFSYVPFINLIYSKVKKIRHPIFIFSNIYIFFLIHTNDGYKTCHPNPSPYKTTFFIILIHFSYTPIHNIYLIFNIYMFGDGDDGDDGFI